MYVHFKMKASHRRVGMRVVEIGLGHSLIEGWWSRESVCMRVLIIPLAGPL